MPINDPKVRDAVDRLMKELVDQGKLIEGGWVAYRALVIPADAPEVQIRESLIAFFSGAQHLFHTITLILDDDAEPTDDDLQRMSQIDRELTSFRDEMLSRLGARMD